MKKYREIMTALVLFMVLAVIWPVQAASVDVRRTGINEMAKYDATHCVVVEYDDFTEDTADTAETLTLTVDAKQSVAFRGMILDTAFDDPTNTTLQVKIGDGADDNYLMENTQIDSDGTEVWQVLPAGDTGTIVVTPQTTDVETDPVLTVTTLEITYDSDGAGAMVTNDVVTNVTVATTTSTVATNATAAFTVSELTRKVYTADDTIDFVFTPSTTTSSLDDYTSGRMRVYLWISDPR